MLARVAFLGCLVSCGGGVPKSTEPLKHACTPNTSVLHVASIAPVPGEHIDYTDEVAYHFVTDEGEVFGESHFATSETVLSVDHDQIGELEVLFKDGRYKPPTKERDRDRDLTGRTFRFSRENDAEVYREGDASAPADDHDALSAYERNDVGEPHWILGLLVDRTYQRGVETHLPGESVHAPAKETSIDARITLQGVERGLATFHLDLLMTKGAQFRITGDAVLDIARARLTKLTFSMDLALAKDANPKGLVIHVDSSSTYRDPDAAPPAVAERCDTEVPTVLHVPWKPPTVGERFVFAQSGNIDLTASGPAGTHRIRSGWDTETDERVLGVGQGVITSLEATIRRSTVHPFAIDAEPATLSHAGKKLTIGWQSPTVVFELDGQPVEAAKDFATQVHYRADVPARYWVTRLVTDRTFERGVEQHFAHEMLWTIAPSPADVRIMLVSVAGDVATFKLEIRLKVDAGVMKIPMYFTGELQLDTRRARPMALKLSGRYDMPDKIQMDGVFMLEQTFRYL
jgi:hypothetical protein